MDAENKRPRKRNDALLKAVFEDNFKDFLRFMYNEADTLFDFNKGFTFMDKELLQIIPDRERKQANRVADLLVRVYLQNGEQRCILVHTEIEGSASPDFGARIYQYHYRIYDRYKLPVETIAIFTGNRSKKIPKTFHYKLFKTALTFEFLSYHIFDHSEEELLKMNNIFAFIVLACQKSLLEGTISEQQLDAYRYTIARTLLQTQQYDKDKILGFFHFLKNLIFIVDNELNKKFNNYINNVSGGTIEMGVIEILKKQERAEGRSEGRSEGLAEGRSEGLAEGKVLTKEEIIKNLILKFNYSDALIAQISLSPLTFVQQQRRRIEEDK